MALLCQWSKKEYKGFSTMSRQSEQAVNAVFFVDDEDKGDSPMLIGVFRGRFKEIYLEIYFLLPDSTTSSVLFCF